MAGDWLVSMNPAEPLLEQGAVAVRDGRIVGVGPAALIDATFDASERLEGKGRVVMPGLINTHSHAAMTILRGIADDVDVMTWLLDYIFPAEVRFVDEQFVRVGTELACAEMIRGGTTTFVDMYYHPDAIAEVVVRCGMRALISATVIDQRSPDAADADEGLANARAFIGRWQGKHPRITPILGPHSVYTLKPTHLAQVGQTARELGVPISIHLSESRVEIDTTRAEHDATPIALLERLAFFDNRVLGAHVVHPSARDVQVLAKHAVGVAHCPTSNMKISSGIAPVTTMLDAGINVGIGTDGAASNNDLGMFEEMRLGAFLQKVATMQPTALPAATVLEMATAGGARAIGLGEEIGSLRVGARADLIQVDLSALHATPVYDVISHLAYVADEQDVRTVIVDGQVLMRERELLTIDEAQVKAKARALAQRIAVALDRVPSNTTAPTNNEANDGN